jgi:hypothetical protein
MSAGPVLQTHDSHGTTAAAELQTQDSHGTTAAAELQTHDSHGTAATAELQTRAAGQQAFSSACNCLLVTPFVVFTGYLSVTTLKSCRDRVYLDRFWVATFRSP